MFNTTGNGGGLVFPAIPTGDPTEIVAAAARLTDAGDSLARSERTIGLANDEMALDWGGVAADAYRHSAGGLATVARGAAHEFTKCVETLRGYARSLEECQTEMRGQQAAFAAAQSEQRTATQRYEQADQALRNAQAGDVPRLTTARTTAQNSLDSASSALTAAYHRATSALNEFRTRARQYQDDLDGPLPGFAGAISPNFQLPGTAGPAFGVPGQSNVPGMMSITANGLQQYTGVLPLKSLPNGAVVLPKKHHGPNKWVIGELAVAAVAVALVPVADGPGEVAIGTEMTAELSADAAAGAAGSDGALASAEIDAQLGSAWSNLAGTLDANVGASAVNGAEAGTAELAELEAESAQEAVLTAFRETTTAGLNSLMERVIGRSAPDQLVELANWCIENRVLLTTWASEAPGELATASIKVLGALSAEDLAARAANHEIKSH